MNFLCRRNPERTEYVYKNYQKTEIRKSPPPHNVTLTKGSVHITVTRAYVNYVLHSPIAQDFLEWVQDTEIPDETFFSSLNHSPHLNVPGAYTGGVLIENLYSNFFLKNT